MGQITKRCKAAFLNPVDVLDGDVVDILTVNVVPKEETKFLKSDRTVLNIRHNGNEQRWGINNITNDRLVDAFGSDSANWVGKRVQINKQKLMVSGKERDVLYGVPLVQTGLAPAEKEKD